MQRVNLTLNDANGEKALSVDEFKEVLMEICTEHLEDNRALAFAFIFYDVRNPQIHKVLDDKRYWEALNDISGDLLTVFSFYSKNESVPILVKKKVRRRKLPKPGDVVLKTMVATDIGSMRPNDYEIKEILDHDGDLTLPCLLFFVVKNNQIFESSAIEVVQERKEEAFNEIKNILMEVADELAKIRDDVDVGENCGYIFAHIDQALRDRSDKIFIKKAINKIQQVRGMTDWLGKIFKDD